MMLTERELAALEMLRVGKASLDQSWLLADAMLRLFPVRTYGDLVIRWDDPITPERLVACGGEMASPTDPLATTCVVDMGNQLWAWFREEQPILWMFRGAGIHELSLPRNMLELWNLMERCGIESECEHGMLP